VTSPSAATKRTTRPAIWSEICRTAALGESPGNGTC
jgi:hypothetical protein